MSSLEPSRARLLVKVATLYYAEGLDQQSIADRLGISRPNVSRLLAAARTSGIVDIRIRSPYPEGDSLERTLEQRFGLNQAVVVQSESAEKAAVEATVAGAAAGLLAETLPSGVRLGVMAGTTVSAVAHALEAPRPRSIVAIPMIGGNGPVGADWHANETARVIANRFHGRYYLLNAPAVLSNPDSRQAFLGEPAIASVLEMAAGCDVALLGVGAIHPDATTVRAGLFTPQELQALEGLGVVGDFGTGFFNREGQIVSTSLDQRFIGLSPREVLAIPKRIGVAYGLAKASALLGALRGGFFTTLVTDEETARLIVAAADTTGA